MKKNFMYAGTLLCAMAAMTGCTSAEDALSEVQSSEFALASSLGVTTKTTIDAEYNVLWAEGDAIYAWGDNVSSTMTLQEGKGTENGKFFGYLTGSGKAEDVKNAFYPATGFDGTKYVFLAERSSDDSASPMYAEVVRQASGEYTAQFNHLCAMLLVNLETNLKGESKVFKLQATGIAGEAQFDATEKTLGTASTNEVAVTLKEGATSFYVPLPAGDYSALTCQLVVDGETIGAGTMVKIQGATNNVVKAGLLYKAEVSFNGMTIGGSTGEYNPIEVGTAEDLKAALGDITDAGSGNGVIKITQNIVIEEEDNWKPYTVDGYNGADIITVEGNGHTISGLTAPLFAGGFAGGSGIIIKDLTIANSTITSTNTLGSGAFIETIDSMDEITLDNCHLKNSSVSGSRTGGLIGWNSGYDNVNDGSVKTEVTITDCTVIECEITGNGTVGGIVGHAGANAWTWNTITNCTVKGCTLTSYDDSYRVGAIVGTANVGEVVINSCTSENNTFKQDNNGSEITRPDGQSDLYGRFVPETTGKLTIDGTAITNN